MADVPDGEDDIGVEARLVERENDRGWRIGYRPRNEGEWLLELRLSEQEREPDRRRSTTENLRGLVLLAVVAAVVFIPLYAMIAEIDTKDFTQYVTPITGIAGTV